MSNFIIKGGKQLSGSITTFTSKNAALGCMYACLLSRKESTLTDVPRIEEVERTREVFGSIGAKTEWTSEHTLKITPSQRITPGRINEHAAMKTRAVLMLIGALAHDFKHFSIPKSGGCKLGNRTVFPHLFALRKLGLSIESTKTTYEVTHKERLKGAEIVMYESGDTTTENVIYAAVLAQGKTIIRFASPNYQVQDTCFLLSSMGAKIEGIGTSTLTIYGLGEEGKLQGANSYPIMPDPIESMILIALGATTRSSIHIQNCPKDFVSLELAKLEAMHFQYEILKTYKSRNGKFDIIDIQTLPSSLVACPDKIEPRPYPGLNIDNLPYFVPIATQAKGTTLIHDWVYENRAIYYMEFQKLGANIVLADPHRVFITGKTALSPAEIMCPPALRPASILLLGMLAAKGKSILRNTYSIDRGYENLYNRLRTLGADIEVISG
jgi:UDP-N-acetylglucosamine 1-carboxyvinyltransferase